MNNRILDLMNCREFYALKAYYDENTIFGALNLERKETRNSAFLSWFFNPMSNHGLGFEPIKLLLRLYFAKSQENSSTYMSLLPIIMSGNYSLEIVENICLEKSVGAVCHQASQDRFDIWTVLKLSYNADDDTREVIIPMVIENKVYSAEGENQTKKYSKAIAEYCNIEHGESKCYLVSILLAPDAIKPSSELFTPITHQDLLTYVIEPLMNNVADNCKSWINDYVRNLSITVNDNYSAYRILAVPKKERELVDRFYAIDGDLIDAIFTSQVEGGKIETILSEERKSQIDTLVCNENASLFDAIWAAEGEILKAVIYVKHLLGKPNGKADFEKCFKPSRINAKYKVTLNGSAVLQGRLSKSQAALAVFKAYMQVKPNATLAELQTAFPISLNDDLHRYYNSMFAVYDSSKVDEGGYMHVTRTEGKYSGNDALAAWDFYDKDAMMLNVEGKEVMCPKKWTQPDFEKLVECIEKMGIGIAVEEVL